MLQWSREPGGEKFAESLARFQSQDRSARMTEEIEKEGFDTARRAVNPFTRAGAHLGRQFRAGRIRHGGRDGGSGARRARLRVRPEVSAADPGRVRPADGVAATPDTMTEAVSNDRVLVQSGRLTGCRPMPLGSDDRGSREARDRRRHGAVP